MRSLLYLLLWLGPTAGAASLDQLPEHAHSDFIELLFNVIFRVVDAFLHSLFDSISHSVHVRDLESLAVSFSHREYLVDPLDNNDCIVHSYYFILCVTNRLEFIFAIDYCHDFDVGIAYVFNDGHSHEFSFAGDDEVALFHREHDGNR